MASPTNLATTTPLPGARIVVVEDNPVLLSLLAQLLSGEGYQVVGHARGADAHLLVRNLRPWAVILDLRPARPPGVEAPAWQLLDRLVRDPATCDIPVVLTASAAAESIERHRAPLPPRHRVRVLATPYGLDQLLLALAEASGLPRADRSTGGQVPHLPSLTPRQREIARLIALGCTNGQIASRLVLQPGTVANHVAHILERLNLANRAQVAAWATRHGLVDGRRAPERPHVA